MNDFERTLKILCDARVRFVVIGGLECLSNVVGIKVEPPLPIAFR